VNILVNALPQSVEIDGTEYELNTDYRASLFTILAFEDSELTQSEKVSLMLDNLFFEIPSDLLAAVKKAQWFLNAGRENKDDGSRRLYSFEKDANLIFAAYQQTHGIDLQSAKMHWWKFLALFMDLGADTAFCSLVGLRSRYYAGKCTKEEKAAIREMGDTFEIAQDSYYSPEEKELIRKIKMYNENPKVE